MAITPTNLSTSRVVGEPGHVDDSNTVHAAVNALTAALAGTYRVADYASLAAAVAAVPAGSTLLIQGTHSIASLNINKDLHLVGDGPTVSILDAGANAYGLLPSGSAVRLTFQDIGFTGGTSATVLLFRDYVRSALFVDCTFAGFPEVGIQTFGTSVECVRCDFSSDGTPALSNAVQHLRGAPSLRLIDCRFRYCHRGLYCTDYEGGAKDVVVEGCHFDGGWMFLKSTASRSGGTVTYAATTLTDTAASFGTIPAWSTVRAMAVKRAGTVTAISGTSVTDSGANFVSASVSRGDIIRTASAWGVVDEVVSATVLTVEDWLSLTTYQTVPAPATTTAYTLYGLVIGRVTYNTATLIGVDLWRNWNGTAATPAAGTLYALAPHTDYQCFVYRADNVRIVNNTIRRSWSDSISAQLVRNAIITGNNIYDGQDVGITVGQPSGDTPGPIVADNRITHVGTAGIWLGNVIDTYAIHHNVIEEAGWLSPATHIYVGITVEQCRKVGIHHNTIKRGNVPNSMAAIHLYSGTASDIDLTDNQTIGFATQDIIISASTITGVTGRFQKDTKITLAGGAVGPLGTFAGANTPESVVPAAVGSTYARTNGGAGTSLYVKESGTGATGWVAK